MQPITGKTTFCSNLKKRGSHHHPNLHQTFPDSSYKEDLDSIAAKKKMSLDKYLAIPTFIRLGIEIKT